MIPSAPSSLSFVKSEAGQRLARTIADKLLATLHGHDHLPRSGSALLVGNHAFLGVDSFALTSLLLLETSRYPRFLAEKNLYRIPVVRDFLHSVGAIPGTPDDAVALLEAGEIVVVYPGGIDDSFKLTRDAYTLPWRGRAGFARVAMRAAAPIIPVAATGIDERYTLSRREPFLGRWFGGSARYDIPIPENVLPRRVPLDFHLCPPIDTTGDPEDPKAIERVRSNTVDALRSVLDPYRKRVASRSP